MTVTTGDEDYNVGLASRIIEDNGVGGNGVRQQSTMSGSRSGKLAVMAAAGAEVALAAAVAAAAKMGVETMVVGKRQDKRGLLGGIWGSTCTDNSICVSRGFPMFGRYADVYLHPQINISALTEKNVISAQQKHNLQTGYADLKN
jgi:hypothetical protein